MEIHGNATHFRHWIYTPQTLSETRTSVESAALSNLLSRVSGPSVDQQQLYIRYFATKIFDYCLYFNLPRPVTVCAVTYFKRFFLRKSVLDNDVKRILMVCIFLATKTQHEPLSLDAFLAKIPNSPPRNQVLPLEIVVSQGIDFAYFVHDPYIALHGLFLDFQSVMQDPKSVQELYALLDTAEKMIHDSFLSDVHFIFKPSQIALAALVQSCHGQLLETINKYIDIKFPGRKGLAWLASVDFTLPAETSKEELMQISQAIHAMEFAAKEVTEEVDSA